MRFRSEVIKIMMLVLEDLGSLWAFPGLDKRHQRTVARQ